MSHLVVVVVVEKNSAEEWMPPRVGSSESWTRIHYGIEKCRKLNELSIEVEIISLVSTVLNRRMAGDGLVRVNIRAEWRFSWSVSRTLKRKSVRYSKEWSTNQIAESPNLNHDLSEPILVFQFFHQILFSLWNALENLIIAKFPTFQDLHRDQLPQDHHIVT